MATSMKSKGKISVFGSGGSVCILMLVLAQIIFPHIVLAHVAINSAPTTSCGSIDSTDLTTHVSNQIDNRINGVSASTGLNLYTVNPLSTTSTPWTRNPGLWSNTSPALNFTGVAAMHSDDAVNLIYNHGATLISPRDFIAAAHFPINVGSYVDFVDANGNHVDRKVVGATTIGGTDIRVESLDSDVPDTITYYPIIASSTLQSMIEKIANASLDVPIVIFNQQPSAQGQALIRSMSFSDLSAGVSHWTYTTGSRAAFSKDLISGDSGQPGFIIIDGQPVFLFANFTTNSADYDGSYINQINTAMTGLGSPYQVTQYNPTCFTQYTLNHPPTWSSVISRIITHPTFSSTSQFTFAASDQDVGQTLTYSLPSFTDLTTSTSYNPALYFSINSSTGALSQTATIDPTLIGHNLQLTVKVVDNGQNVASTTQPVTIDYRNNLSQNGMLVLDPNFLLTTLDNNSGFNNLAFDSNNKLVIGGTFGHINSIQQSSITRLNTDGSIDSTFASNIGTGFLTTGASSTENAVFVDGSGKIVVGGNQNTFNGTTVGVLTRLNTDGTLDTAFTSALGSAFSQGGTVHDAININGEILATGLFLGYDGVTFDRFLMVKNDGTADSTFASNAGSLTNGTGYSLAFDGTNIYIGGSFSTYKYPNSTTASVGNLIRLSANGTFDSVFNSAIGTGFNNRVNGIAVRPDGKIVVVGTFTSFNGTPVNSIALLNSDGTLNTAFTANTASYFSDTLFSVIAEPDNSIIVGGNPFTFNGVASANGIMKLNADGTVNTAFNTALGDGLYGGVVKLVKRSDGAIAAVGNLTQYGNTLLNNSATVLVTQTPSAPTISAGANGLLSGTGSSTASVFLYENNNPIGTAVVDSSGNWQTTVSLSPGTHSVSAIQVLTLTTIATSSASSVTVTTPSSSGSFSSGGGGGGGSSSGGGGSVTQIIPKTTIVSTLAVPNTPVVPIFSHITNLGIGTSGADVKNLQIFLNAFGYKVAASGAGSPGNETSTFGPLTSKALMSFQKAHNIPVTGVLDSLTGLAINIVENISSYVPQSSPIPTTQASSTIPSPFSRPLSLGSIGLDVRALQVFLNTHGYIVIAQGLGSPGNEVIVFGPHTAQALAAFQRANGITSEIGYLGSTTIAAIQKIE